MQAFATVEQLQTRWRMLDADEQECASVRLMDASVLMASEMDRAGVDYLAPAESFKSVLEMVCCQITMRAIGNDSPMGVSQYSQGAIGLSESYTYANPTGDLYLTKVERKLLGIGGGRVSCVSLV